MPASPDNRELLAVVRAWAAVNYPGCPVEYITIHCRFLAAPIQLADAPAPPTPPPAPSEADEGGGLSPVVLDILHVLREIKRPLTRTRLLEELAKRGKHYNERTVAGYLAALVQDGTLENPGAGKGGYRLPQEDLE